MDILLICTMISLFFTVLIAIIAIITALYTMRTFKRKNIYDQWMAALTTNYHSHYFTVKKLIEGAKNCEINDCEFANLGGNVIFVK